MKRITIAWFDWEWNHLLAHRAVDVSDDVLRDPEAVHRFIVGLARSALAGIKCPPDVHAAACAGSPTAAELEAAMPDIKEHYAKRDVPYVESTEPGPW